MSRDRKDLIEVVPVPIDGPSRAIAEGNRRRRSRRNLTLVACTAVLLVVGFSLAGLRHDGGKQLTTTADTTDPRAHQLAGRRFVSTSVTQAGSERPLVDRHPILLAFDDDTLTAQTGCNTATAKYSLDGPQFIVSEVGTNDIACQPALMDQESWFLGILRSDPTLVVNGDHVTLTSGDTAITFTNREATSYDRPLIGTTWALESIIDDRGASDVPAGVTATIEFSATKVRWQACNLHSGPVTITDTTITMGDGGSSTLMRCPDPRGEVDDRMSVVLMGEVTYEINGDALLLRNGSQALQLRAT